MWWGEGYGLFHPSIQEVRRVVEKAFEERACGLLVVPDWVGSEAVSIVERENAVKVELLG